MPLPLACHLLRAMLPALANDWRRQMHEQMQAREAEERADATDRAERLARRAPRKAQRAAAPSADDARTSDLLHEWRLLTGQAALTVTGAPSVTVFIVKHFLRCPERPALVPGLAGAGHGVEDG